MFCRKWCPELTCANFSSSPFAWIHHDVTQNLLENECMKKYSFKANLLLLQTAILKCPVLFIKRQQWKDNVFWKWFLCYCKQIERHCGSWQQNYKISMFILAHHSFHACCACSVVYWFPWQHDTDTSASFPFIPRCKQMHPHCPRRGSPVLLSRSVPIAGLVLWGPREGVIPQMNFSSHLSSPLKNVFLRSRRPRSCCRLIFNIMCFNFGVWYKSDGYWS